MAQPPFFEKPIFEAHRTDQRRESYKRTKIPKKKALLPVRTSLHSIYFFLFSFPCLSFSELGSGNYPLAIFPYIISTFPFLYPRRAPDVAPYMMIGTEQCCY